MHARDMHTRSLTQPLIHIHVLIFTHVFTCMYTHTRVTIKHIISHSLMITVTHTIHGHTNTHMNLNTPYPTLTHTHMHINALAPYTATHSHTCTQMHTQNTQTHSPLHAHEGTNSLTRP